MFVQVNIAPDSSVLVKLIPQENNKERQAVEEKED
jgi:hypothetical protein